MKKNILFISSWYPNQNNPTLGIFVKRHAEAVALQNNVAVLFVCAQDHISNTKLSAVEEIENNVYNLITYYKKVNSKIPIISNLQKAFRYLTAFFYGYNLLKKKWGNATIVHANVVFPIGAIALLLKLFTKTPYIITEHWTGYLAADGRYKGFLNSLIYKKIVSSAKFITPVSDDLKLAMQNHQLKCNYEVVPNVVDVNLFYPLKKKEINNKKSIIHVSALDDDQKNISGILRVIKTISEKRTDFELLIVGDGKDRNKLEILATDLCLLNQFVYFKGIKMKEELAELMKQSSFFVLFSNFENLPCVIIESLACGVPVIVSRIGGTPEHISKQMGLIVEPNDEKGLEKAIEDMLDNYLDYDMNVLRQYAIEKFSYEKVSQQFNTIYEKALANINA